MDVEQDRRGPLRLLGRSTAVVLAVAFVALLVYGVVTQAPDPAIDDALASGRPRLRRASASRSSRTDGPARGWRGPGAAPRRTARSTSVSCVAPR